MRFPGQISVPWKEMSQPKQGARTDVRSTPQKRINVCFFVVNCELFGPAAARNLRQTAAPAEHPCQAPTPTPPPKTKKNKKNVTLMIVGNSAEVGISFKLPIPLRELRVGNTRLKAFGGIP